MTDTCDFCGEPCACAMPTTTGLRVGECCETEVEWPARIIDPDAEYDRIREKELFGET